MTQRCTTEEETLSRQGIRALTVDEWELENGN